MSKRAALAKIIEDIRASYWFLPTVLALLAILLSQLTLHVDRAGGEWRAFLPQAWTNTQVEGARATLSVVATSIIGVAGVMFSLTLVAVSFAAGNFGPRLIGNFMRDRGTQWSLGILVSTFVYALLILRAVENDQAGAAGIDAFVPHLSMLVALALTGVSIITMIYYVHHIPETINVSNITATLGRKLTHALKELIEAGKGDDAESRPLPERSPDHRVVLGESGYVQTWNKAQLVALADEHDLSIRVECGAGDFVSEFTAVLSVWGAPDLPEDLAGALRDCFALGAVPTEPQNLLFFVQQLVEMIARALSPGVNDPFTAINGLNWIYVGLATAAQYEGGLRASAQDRVHFEALTLEMLVQRGIDDAAPYLRSDPLARAHLLRLLDRLIAECEGTPGGEVFQAAKARCAEAFAE